MRQPAWANICRPDGRAVLPLPAHVSLRQGPRSPSARPARDAPDGSGAAMNRTYQFVLWYFGFTFLAVLAFRFRLAMRDVAVIDCTSFPDALHAHRIAEELAKSGVNVAGARPGGRGRSTRQGDPDGTPVRTGSGRGSASGAGKPDPAGFRAPGARQLHGTVIRPKPAAAPRPGAAVGYPMRAMQGGLAPRAGDRPAAGPVSKVMKVQGFRAATKSSLLSLQKAS